MPGKLELVKKVTVSGTSTTVDITDVFSAKYINYMVTASDVLQAASSGASSLHVQLINSTGGVEVTSGDYHTGFLQMRDNTSFFEGTDTTDVKMQIILGQIDDDDKGNGAVAYFYSPFASDTWTWALTESSCVIGTQYRALAGASMYIQEKSITGFRIALSADGITQGTFCVYGIAEE